MAASPARARSHGRRVCPPPAGSVRAGAKTTAGPELVSTKGALAGGAEDGGGAGSTVTGIVTRADPVAAAGIVVGAD